MKESNFEFHDPFLMPRREGEGGMKTFDWDKAALLIKERLKDNPNLVAEAGLQGDWNYTGGIIFENGKPTNEYYTYLSSRWAIPSIDIDGDTIPCWKYGDESGSKWPELNNLITN